MDYQAIRDEFMKIRRNFLSWAGEEETDKLIKAKVHDIAANHEETRNPEIWLNAIKLVRVPCQHCDGSGIYRWGPTINGVFRGKSGDCHQCQGKGKMDSDDCIRASVYYRHKIVGMH